MRIVWRLSKPLLPIARFIIPSAQVYSAKAKQTRVNTTTKILNTLRDVEIKVQDILTLSHKQEE